MLTAFFAQNLWLVALLWALTYLSDYYLTIYSARLFKSNLQAHILHEGSLELTPIFQKDVDNLKLFSGAFYSRLAFSIGLVLVIGWLFNGPLELPYAYHFILGGLFLREAAVHLRHFRNISMAKCANQTGSLRGKVEYSRWLIYRTSALDLWSYAAFFLLISFFAGFWFFFGGAFFTAFTGLQHWQISRKFKPALPPFFASAPAVEQNAQPGQMDS